MSSKIFENSFFKNGIYKFGNIKVVLITNSNPDSVRVNFRKFLSEIRCEISNQRIIGTPVGFMDILSDDSN